MKRLCFKFMKRLCFKFMKHLCFKFLKHLCIITKLIEIIYKYYKQYLYTNMADKEKSVKADKVKSVKAKPNLKITRKKTVAAAASSLDS